MSDDNSPDLNIPPEIVSSEPIQSTSPPSKKSKAKYIIMILLFFLVGGGFIIYQLWNTLEQSKQQAKTTATQVQQLEQKLQYLQQEVEQQANAQQRLQQVESQQQQLTSTYKILYQRTRKSGDTEEWSIAEINYLLQVAQQRLRLEHDIETALLALKAADERLQKASPLFLPIREQVSKDIQLLSQLKAPDLFGMMLKLGQFSNQATTLPLLQGLQGLPTQEKTVSQKLDKPHANDWSDIGEAVWQELQKLVIIRRNTQLESGLLSSEQRVLIADMLRLKLENAKTLLLTRKTALFHQELKDIQIWLERYYDQQDTQVSSLITELKNMLQIQLVPTIPDISQSLVALQKISAELAPNSTLEPQVTNP
jgi:uroporphyrin-III C-methyltransferase